MIGVVMLEDKTTARQRQRLYLAAVAAIALLVTYKVIDPAHAPLWLDLAVNVIGYGTPAVASGTAAAVVKKQREDGTVE
ncbi:hypothetical protein ACORG1_12990 [Mycobacterium sp. TJFP1]